MSVCYNDQEMTVEDRLKSYGHRAVAMMIPGHEGVFIGRIRQRWLKRGFAFLPNGGGKYYFKASQVEIATRAGTVVLREDDE